MNRDFKLLIAAGFLAYLSIATADCKPESAPVEQTVSTKTPASRATITVGPFDLHRNYKSMEGPYAWHPFRVCDLLNSKQVTMPESMITFIEGKKESALSMNGAPLQDKAAGGRSEPPIGLVESTNKTRELFWFKGIQLQVLDENDKVLPTGEFICHLNLDVDPKYRKKIFPAAEHSTQSRLVTLTQGQTSFHFPEGFAVPVSSDEVWTLTFQAANHASKVHRRIKHLCTIDFVKDSELKAPMKALLWHNPYISVALGSEAFQVDRSEHHGPDCLAYSAGESAQNQVAGSTFKDKAGKLYSSHWAVPPGSHTYVAPISEKRDDGFANKDRKIHAVWSHIHPLCSRTSLVRCEGTNKDKIFTVTAKTKTKDGLELLHIDTISTPTGIKMPAGNRYELEATYDNCTDEVQDSMVAVGIFFADESFRKPDWKLVGSESALRPEIKPSEAKGRDLFCGPKSQSEEVQSKTANPFFEKFDLFEDSTDGPLLTEERSVEIETNQGKLNVVLVPAWAPKHATQIHRLLTKGVYNGTPLSRYQPGFILQTAVAEQKVEGEPRLSDEQQDLLRRLPLEIESQSQNTVSHKKFCLSMARFDDAPDTGLTSFSILLGDAPHLDHKYTIFGYLDNDATSLKTLERIQSNWGLCEPIILQARQTDRSLASKKAKNLTQD